MTRTLRHYEETGLLRPSIIDRKTGCRYTIEHGGYKPQDIDIEYCEELTREAFWNVYAPGCVEHFVLHHYRSNPDFIPELDFVMEENVGVLCMEGNIEFENPEAFNEFEATFPPKEKKHLEGQIVDVCTMNPNGI